MSRPRSDLEALREDLRKVYDGDPWHGSSITDVLKGIDADVAARRSIPDAHTIWELVLHMTGWTREVASRVRGAQPKSPPEDWPVPRFGAGAAGTGYTVGTVIRGLLQHHTYHEGQIAILKGAAETTKG